MEQNVFQCGHCSFWIFYEPFPADVYSHCFWEEQGLSKIDLATGFSPMVYKCGHCGEKCDKFCVGRSISYPPGDKPFEINPIRSAGEKELGALLVSRASVLKN